MNRDALRRYLTLLSVVAALAVNILANALPLNGLNTGQISDQFDVYFVPAGYVFAIWGVIYIGWIAFVVYQFLPSSRSSQGLRALGYWFALSGVLNAVWLFCWHYQQFGLSVLVMLALLATLIVSYLRLDVGRLATSSLERWCVDVPFGLYLGWISVATIANISDFLFFIHWDGLGIDPQVWAVIMLAVASLLGILMARGRRDAAYLLVFVWAFAGIGVKQQPAALVAGAAWVAAALALGLAVWSRLPRPRATA